MARSRASFISGTAGDIAALAGLALLLLDIVGVPADSGRPATLATDAGFAVAALVAAYVARRDFAEAPSAAFGLLVVGAAPAVLLAGRWPVPAAVGVAIAIFAPHCFRPHRIATWIATGGLLAAASLHAGVVPGIVAPLVAVSAGVLSRRLARRLSGASGRAAHELEQELERERLRSAELRARLARYEGGEALQRRSGLQGSLTHRLGAMGAIARSIAQELRPVAVAPLPEEYRVPVARCADRAERLARLAVGGAAREQEATLALVWPRVSELLGATVKPFHRVEVHVPADLPPVAGSAAEWVQILMALADNSLTAMPTGGVLTIEAAPGPEPGHARVVVRDTGVGIPPELLPQLMEPFQTSRADEGAEGLGLATVAAIVEALEGRIGIISQQGQGTRIELDVPFYAPAAPPATAQGAAPMLEGTVLLADDDPQVRRALRRLMESFGLAVAEADSGTVALAQFTADPDRFRALVLDVVMPGTPVEEMIVRAREVRPAVPVLLVSGYNVGQILDDVVALGGVRFLQKPLIREELFASLRDLFTVAGD
jgi:signal transduction histidine kinase/CheY-like chemotaxis protein